MYELAAARLHTLLVTQKKAMYSQQKTNRLQETKEQEEQRL